ncbi:cellulose-binding protein [Penicillium citrinum]|uniref:Cellulose-binding protein n=1 Tax=Penicillium citrinum TaxID=5077 RepID=A0A9W9PEI3_PENCI|nr:cellulose-binding protein [Penicillium citrinum]KAJ5242961.1 cellulose-binding protein [Penicillium citrinum]
MVDLTTLVTFPSKPRIFILTDMLNEPDDSQSLVRYLLYANEFDTRVLIPKKFDESPLPMGEWSRISTATCIQTSNINQLRSY